MMKCLICNSINFKIILRLRDIRYNITDKEFQILKCKKCGTLITTENNFIVDGYKYYPNEYLNFQKIDYDIYSPKFSSNILGFNYVVKGRISFLDKIEINSNCKILDVGCGNGNISYYIKNKYKCEIEGIEPIESAVNFTREKGINVFKGTLESYENFSKNFDYILLIHLIEHLQNPKNSIKKIYSLLSERGKLVIACPNASTIERKIFRKYWDGWDVPRHIHHFNVSSIKYLLREAGFKEISIYYEVYTLSVRSLSNLFYKNTPYDSRVNRIRLYGLGYIFKILKYILPIFKNSGAIQIIAEK